MELRFVVIASFALVSFLDIHRGLAAESPTSNPSQPQPMVAAPTPNEVINRLAPKIETLDRNGLFELGMAYEKADNPAAAQKAYTAALAKNSRDAEVKTRMAVVLDRQKKTKEAIQLLKEVLEKQQYVPAYEQLIEIYQARKNKYELRLLYVDMLDKVGERVEWVSKLCELTTLEGQFELAFKHCERGIALDKNRPDNFVYLAMARRDTGKKEAGEKLLEKAAQKFTKSYLTQVTYGDMMTENKNFVAAYTAFQRAMQISPNDTRAKIGYASSAAEIQKYAESFKVLNETCPKDRTILPTFRRVTNSLRLSKNEAWLKKFEAGIETCNE